MSRKQLMTGTYVDDEGGRLTYKVHRKWRRVVVGNFREWRQCPRCAAIVDGHWGQTKHIIDHEERDDLAERLLTLLLGEPGENGYDWGTDTGVSGESSGPDTGPDTGDRAPDERGGRRRWLLR